MERGPMKVSVNVTHLKPNGTELLQCEERDGHQSSSRWASGSVYHLTTTSSVVMATGGGGEANPGGGDSPGGGLGGDGGDGGGDGLGGGEGGEGGGEGGGGCGGRCFFGGGGGGDGRRTRTSLQTLLCWMWHSCLPFTVLHFCFLKV